MAKYQFTVTGLQGLAKTKLYQFVPVETNPDYKVRGHEEHHKVQVPLVGRFTDGADSDFRDFFGKNIVCPLIFKGRTARENLIIPEAIVNVIKKKRIVKTEVVGGSGTVKEFIGDDDLDITITVGIVATDEADYILDEYPGEAIRKVQEFLDQKTIDVWSPFLELFNIDGGEFKLVVESYEVQQTTYSNRQVITINAISDVDYTIFMEEN